MRETGERKKAEEALRAAKTFAENLIETANTMVIGFDYDGKVNVFNKAAEEITGYSREEVMEKGWKLVSPRDRYGHVWKEFRRWREGHFSRKFENPILTKSGVERYIAWQNSAVVEQGRIVGLIAFGMDITERRRGERELQEKTRRLEELNAAMRALLRQRDADRIELEQAILTNVRTLILPYAEKLKTNHLTEDQRVYLTILESHLAEITRPFARSLAQRFPGLTPAEIRIADLIREGKSSKEIAGLLNVSEFTILAHRQNIRKKLGIKKGKINLGSFLRSFQA